MTNGCVAHRHIANFNVNRSSMQKQTLCKSGKNGMDQLIFIVCAKRGTVTRILE